MAKDPEELTPIQTMQKRLLDAKEANKVQVEEAIELREMELQITKLSSPIHLDRQLKQAVTSKLDQTLAVLESVTDDTVIRKVFGFGLQADKILTIARTINFSKHEAKADMIAMLALDEQTIEDINDSMGQTPYFSPRTMEMNDAVFPNIELLIKNINLLANDMHLTVDTSKITQTNIDAMYKRAEDKAKILEQNTLEHAELLKDEEKVKEYDS